MGSDSRSVRPSDSARSTCRLYSRLPGQRARVALGEQEELVEETEEEEWAQENLEVLEVTED